MEGKKVFICPNCDSKRIVEGVAIGLSSEVGNVGPRYKLNFMISGVVQMYCDLCPDCGEVIRMFIKDTTQRNWIKTAGTIGSK